ncbi:pseudouridine synthase [Trametes meyenii]|nr:pseudouridine synthase [Trametes meyenii]
MRQTFLTRVPGLPRISDPPTQTRGLHLRWAHHQAIANGSSKSKEHKRRRLSPKDLAPRKLVLYADKSIVVLDKPNGLVSQPSPTTSDADQTAVAFKNIESVLSLPEPLRTVHRLDKPTTGAFLLARTAAVARELSLQFLRRETVQKTYLALACGDASAFPRTRGVIESTWESVDGRVRVAPWTDADAGAEGRDPSVKKAVTEYQLVATSAVAPLSLVRLRLITGYKAQIRAQLAQVLGAPILSDTTFGTAKHVKEIQRSLGDFRIMPCLYLHSSRLSFTRYRPTGPRKEFRFGIGAPLPQAFRAVCDAAGIPLERDDLDGGVWVDGVKVRGRDAVDPEEVPATPAQSRELVQAQAQVAATSPEDTIGQLGGMWYGPGV